MFAELMRDKLHKRNDKGRMSGRGDSEEIV